MKKKIDLKKWIIIFLLLVIVALISILISSQVSSNQNQNMSMMMMNGIPVMVTKTVKTFDVSLIPTIRFTMQKNTTDGWNLHIMTTNFTFTPDKVDTNPELGTGHVHLYIDGVLYVVYSSWYFIGDLPKGKHIIRVALANNDHSIYARHGKYIDSTQTITVQ